MRNSDTERLIIPKTDVDRLFTRDELAATTASGREEDIIHRPGASAE